MFQNNAYTYAANSDLAQTQTITSSGTSTAWNYYYDPLNRLLEAAGGSAGTYNYSYDGDGNLLTRTTNPGAGTTTPAIQTATYNADNELCWVIAGANSNPCSTTAPSGGYAATYDAAGNLQTLGSAAGTTTLVNNDEEQTTSINPYAAGAQTLGYRGKGQNDPFQTGTQPTGGAAAGLEEDTLGVSAQYPVSSSGSTPSSSYTYYTHAPDGTLLAERGGGGSTSADDYYYVQDANDSVVALTNSSDAVANTYTYDPFGTTTASSGTAPNSFGFDGGYYASCSPTTGTGANCPSAVPSSAPTSPTSQNGLILFGTRYYNPALAMWTQPDPDAASLATDPTQADAYSFAGDNPVSNADPTGLSSGLGSQQSQENADNARCAKHPKDCPATHYGADVVAVVDVIAKHVTPANIVRAYEAVETGGLGTAFIFAGGYVGVTCEIGTAALGTPLCAAVGTEFVAAGITLDAGSYIEIRELK